jgi:hypothetical protein
MRCVCSRRFGDARGRAMSCTLSWRVTTVRGQHALPLAVRWAGDRSRKHNACQHHTRARCQLCWLLRCHCHDDRDRGRLTPTNAPLQSPGSDAPRQQHDLLPCPLPLRCLYPPQECPVQRPVHGCNVQAGKLLQVPAINQHESTEHAQRVLCTGHSMWESRVAGCKKTQPHWSGGMRMRMWTVHSGIVRSCNRMQGPCDSCVRREGCACEW